METSSFVALAKQQAIHLRTINIANNIANASTPGYRKNEMNFAAYVSRQTTTSPIIYSIEHPSRVNLEAGTFTVTDNQLDLAIDANERAFFVVQARAEGRPLLTRSGIFRLDESGRIVTPSGDTLLGINDQPIVLPGIDTKVTVSQSGEVLEGDVTVGQIKILEVPPGSSLEFRGRSLFETNATRPPGSYSIRQGLVEGSNVQPVTEMTSLMEITRQYEMLQQLLTEEHTRLNDLIDKLPVI